MPSSNTWFAYAAQNQSAGEAIYKDSRSTEYYFWLMRDREDGKFIQTAKISL
jgi:hypothetical protein